MTSRRALMASGALLLVCGYQPAAHSQDSIAVYEALFREFGQPNRTYVVHEEPINPRDVLLTEREAVLRVYRFPIEWGQHLKNDFGAVPIRLLAHAEYLEIFSDARGCREGWKLFHERFPQAKVLIELSPVAIRADGREALVIMKGGSACFGSSVDLLLFTRTGSSWKFKEATNVGRS
jgi:hypothetical protein